MGEVKAVVIHYVGNPGTSAEFNRRYWDNITDNYGSAHYVIDAQEVIRCVPENEVAYHAGPHAKATPWATSFFGGEQANTHSIGIELCHPDATGRFTQIVQAKARLLSADLCIRYDLDPMTNIITHNMVTGKDCPRFLVAHPEELHKFRRAVDAIVMAALAV
jgi:N-acetylmuramoyl-L-alanine amidase